MTTDTKVADLPKAWRATSKAAGSTPVAATFNVCADELDAALSRQDAQPAQPDEVDFYVCTNCDAYYRDSPVSECDCAVGARDFRHVRMAPVTQPEKQGAGDGRDDTRNKLREAILDQYAFHERLIAEYPDFSAQPRPRAERLAPHIARRDELLALLMSKSSAEALTARQPVGQEPVAYTSETQLKAV